MKKTLLLVNTVLIICMAVLFAYVAQVDLDEMSDQEILDLLDKAKKVLTLNECAISKNAGHNDDAVQLYKEICEIEDQIKKPDDQKDKDNQKNKDDKKDKKEKQDKSDSREDKVNEILQNQQEGTGERSHDLDSDKTIGNYEYYDGKPW